MAKNQEQRHTKGTEFATRLGSMVAEAGEMGLYVTMRKLHEAVQAVGWEISDKNDYESHIKKLTKPTSSKDDKSE